MPREPLTRGDVFGIVLTILALPVFFVVGYLVLTIILYDRYTPIAPPLSQLEVVTNAPSSAK
jgi:hypothetical protein